VIVEAQVTLKEILMATELANAKESGRLIEWVT
jgi:hypothetical protein